MALRSVQSTLLEKAARDNGFDLVKSALGSNWLRAASSQAPLVIWLSPIGDDLFLLGVSEQKVLTALAGEGAPFTNPLPEGAVGALSALSFSRLNELVRRAFQLSRSLPDELLHVFEAEVRTLPRATEAERLVIQRIGQDIFRNGLLERWDRRCVVTGLAVPELLRASHMKPWAECATDAERLDSNNGLLLAAHLDAAFDAGLITFEEAGRLVVSTRLTGEAQELLGLRPEMRVHRLTPAHQPYLSWHRSHVFKAG